MSRLTSFQRVAEMNEAYNNPRGNPNYIDWTHIRSQSKNIFDEYCELLKALGMDENALAVLKSEHARLTPALMFCNPVNLLQTRDALCDVQVFAMGAQHLLGADGDNDMEDVVDGVMTRFVKNGDDKQATIAKHAAAGVTDVYFEGEFPRMIMKSGSDQPDAPKGKFMKSASYRDTVWRDMPGQRTEFQFGGIDFVRTAPEAGGDFDPNSCLDI